MHCSLCACTHNHKQGNMHVRGILEGSGHRMCQGKECRFFEAEETLQTQSIFIQTRRDIRNTSVSFIFNSTHRQQMGSRCHLCTQWSFTFSTAKLKLHGRQTCPQQVPAC